MVQFFSLFCRQIPCPYQFEDIVTKKGQRLTVLIPYVFVVIHCRVWFETTPYNKPQNILFFYKPPLAERSQSRAYPYHIHPCLQIFHIANRTIAVYLNTLNNLTKRIYNLDFRNCFG